MKKILILTSDINLKALLNLQASRYFDVEIINRTSVPSSMEYLKSHLDAAPVAVIADEHFPSGSATRIKKELNNFEKVIPVIALLDRLETNLNGGVGFYYALEKRNILGKLDEILSETLSYKSESELQAQEYLPLDLEILLYLNLVHHDCFIKLSDQKFVKILNQGDTFTKADFQKYRDKKVVNFYIKTTDVNIMVEKLSENISTMSDLALFTDPNSLSKLRKQFTEKEDVELIEQISSALEKAETRSLPYEEGTKTSCEALGLMRKVNDKFGVDSKFQHLAKASVLLSLSTIQNAPEINSLVEKAQMDEDNYLNDHSVLLAHLACQIAGLMGWSSNLTYYKLTLASYIHDITLNNSRLARFRGIPDLMLKADQFSEEEIRSYIAHTKQASSLINQFRMIPPDTDIIVSQHHERPDGTGFPEKINHSLIAPLAAIFIVAHDLVSFILSKPAGADKTQKHQWNMVTFLNQHRFMYQQGLFKDIFTVMWKKLTN